MLPTTNLSSRPRLILNFRGGEKLSADQDLRQPSHFPGIVSFRLDSSAMGKKLSDIWSTVSASEKTLWKRRAKRLSAKERSVSVSPSKPVLGKKN